MYYEFNTLELAINTYSDYQGALGFHLINSHSGPPPSVWMMQVSLFSSVYTNMFQHSTIIAMMLSSEYLTMMIMIVERTIVIVMFR